MPSSDYSYMITHCMQTHLKTTGWFRKSYVICYAALSLWLLKSNTLVKWFPVWQTYFHPWILIRQIMVKVKKNTYGQKESQTPCNLKKYVTITHTHTSSITFFSLTANPPLQNSLALIQLVNSVHSNRPALRYDAVFCHLRQRSWD